MCIAYLSTKWYNDIAVNACNFNEFDSTKLPTCILYQHFTLNVFYMYMLYIVCYVVNGHVHVHV